MRRSAHGQGRRYQFREVNTMASQENQEIQAFQDLKSAIRQRQPGRLYFFHGEETFLLHYYLEQIKILGKWQTKLLLPL